MPKWERRKDGKKKLNDAQLISQKDDTHNNWKEEAEEAEDGLREEEATAATGIFSKLQRETSCICQ